MKKYLFKNGILPSKGIGFQSIDGRNRKGKITVRFIGGGFKRNFRLLNFIDTGYIQSVHTDTNRSSHIAWCKNISGENFYKIASAVDIKSLEVGSILLVKMIKSFPVGSLVSSISIKPWSHSLFARSFGSNAKIIKHEGFETILRLPSGIIIKIKSNSLCIEGTPTGFTKTKSLTAGSSRRNGIRPRVSGTSMNPIDHPNGGKTRSSKFKNIFGGLAKI